ncbi:MAG: ScyD/ScyE family protein, partial [Thermoleophilaceae bacterium]|nr:ScyD/ScyE family protein [Thermoleophilaceae bacterium]
MPRSRLLLVATLIAALSALGGTAAARTPSLEVVASGLDNPRGLAISKSSSIYVAEAGRGGAGPCVASPEGEGDVCIGSTGAVTKIWKGGQRRIVTGLPSVAGADGSATGPHDVALTRSGGTYVVVGLGGNLETRTAFGPLGAGLGRLYSVSYSGRARSIADLVAYEAASNPDGGEIDSNPYSVTTRWDRPVVADAGGNDLVKVSYHGLSTAAVFPDRLVA